ncbi:MAG: tRNA(His) guanylyltransferase Thg1 family protein, partial [Spirochaetaceae bacterium]|nr:tRNA(His) guanylyltransferase Thg1 family protein [Spirochaetaceae bacterium]
MKFDEFDQKMRIYEQSLDSIIIPNIYMAARIDGRNFTRLTKEICQFEAPFDKLFRDYMTNTVKHLMVCGFRVIYGYTQSDEISLLLTDYDNLDSDAWFDKNLQKMASISASRASMEFNRVFIEKTNAMTPLGNGAAIPDSVLKYSRKAGTAVFDSRVFVLPKEEVCNYFLWRQQDATKNAIQMLGRAHFSHKKMHGLNGN